MRSTASWIAAVVLGAMLAPGSGIAADEGSAVGGYPPGIREIAFTSSLDGSSQPALFGVPEDAENVPLLVALHTWSSDWRHPYLAPLARGCRERGWAFLHPDFRGPNDRPEACGSDLAVADIEDAVAWALRHASIDPDRVYLAGASGGGHMALLMAGRAPSLWAAVSAWVPIVDCAAWHAECTSSGRRYARDLERCCGGPPGTGPEVDAEYARRSPLTWLSRAVGLPIAIHAGIRDGHDGSVPISHSLRAFNVLARDGDRISEDAIGLFTAEARMPPGLVAERVRDEVFGEKAPLWRRRSGEAEVTIFDGGHEMIPAAVFAFLEGRRRPFRDSKDAAASGPGRPELRDPEGE